MNLTQKDIDLLISIVENYQETVKEEFGINDTMYTVCNELLIKLLK